MSVDSIVCGYMVTGEAMFAVNTMVLFIQAAKRLAVDVFWELIEALCGGKWDCSVCGAAIHIRSTRLGVIAVLTGSPGTGKTIMLS